jgi:hypothetical protein
VALGFASGFLIVAIVVVVARGALDRCGCFVAGLPITARSKVAPNFLALYLRIYYLAIGGTALNARITRRSFQQLGIHVGLDVYALVKAVSFDQRSVGYA